MHVMMQILVDGDGHYLPDSLSIINTYAKMTTGIKQVAIMVKNLTSAPVTIARGDKIA